MACSSAATAGGVTVDEAWVRAMPPGQSVTALYFTVENNSGESCTLTSVSTPEASRTELHRTTEEDGVARMRLQASIDIPAQGEAQLRPGGDHIMLFDVGRQLARGDQVSAELDFGACGQIVINAEVREPTRMHEAAPHHHH